VALDLALSTENVKMDAPVILSSPKRLDVGSAPMSP
jgi:hypothetical protein